MLGLTFKAGTNDLRDSPALLVAEMLARQSDVEIVKKQDYIQTPNYNGYRSLHMDIRVPVYLSDRTEYVVAEIQIRTIAMDFWASLEHDIRYKADKSKLPAGINEEMFECAGKIAEIDRPTPDPGRRAPWLQLGHHCLEIGGRQRLERGVFGRWRRRWCQTLAYHAEALK